MLAAGTAREWRSTWYGVAAAIAVLAVVTAVLGPAVGRIPLGPLRLFGLKRVRAVRATRGPRG